MTTENEKSLPEDSGKLEILKEGQNFVQIQLSNYEKTTDCITDKDVKRISYQDYLGFEIVKCFESGLETVRIWNKQDSEISIVLPFSVFDNRKVMLVIRNLGYVDAACYLDLKRAIDERQKSGKVTWIHERVGFASYHGKFVFKYYNILNAPFQSTYTGADFNHKNRVCGINQTSCDIQPKGTIKDWIDSVQGFTKDHPFLQIILCAALSGLVQMLLGDSDKENLILNICGDTSIGKSKACKLALAMFGTPEKLFLTENNTDNSLVTFLSKYSFIPITADDRVTGEDKSKTKQAVRKLIQFIFRIADGKIRGTAQKGNNHDETKYFCPVLMSTETSMAPAMRSSGRAGQFARILEINCNRGDLISSREKVTEIERFTNSCHGIVIEPFVQYFLDNKEDLQLEKRFDALRNKTFDAIQSALTSSNLQEEGMIDRLSKQVAIILLSAHLLNRAFQLNFDIPGMQEILVDQVSLQLQALEKEDLDVKKILQFINDNTNRFANSVQSFDAQKHNAILLAGIDGCAELIVPSDNIGQIFEKPGRTKSLKRLKEREILRGDDQGRLTSSRIIKSGDERAYIFDIK